MLPKDSTAEASMGRIIFRAAVAAAVIMSVPVADLAAQACSTTDVQFGSGGIGLDPGDGGFSFAGANASNCLGFNGGNDVPNNVAPITTWLNGLQAAPWVATGKSDNAVGPTNPFDFQGSGSSGFFSLINDRVGPFAISLKTGSTYSVYFFASAGPGDDFAYDFSDLRGGFGLSHATLWETQGEPFIVPEPSSALLLAGGLAGLGMAARRRRRA